MYADNLVDEIGPAAKKRRHDEDDLQAAVVDMLRWGLPADALHWHCPNGGKRHKREAQRLVRLGVRAGIPDIHIAYQGRLFCIELKIPGEGLSDAQRQVVPRLRGCGVPVAICTTPEEVERTLAAWGIPLSVRVAA